MKTGNQPTSDPSQDQQTAIHKNESRQELETTDPLVLLL